jgi:hypothetical protein
MEKTIIEKALIKALGIAGCILMTVFAGTFALVGLCAFIMTIIEPNVIGVIGCVGLFGCSLICWENRREMLV